jgi:hypothetical protein
MSFRERVSHLATIKTGIRTTINATTFVLGFCGISSIAPEATAQAPRVLTCEQVVFTRAGVGHAYRGAFRNDDYRASGRIPPGLVGWSGVANSAPFHGFTIFLNHEQTSCIVFEIHIRVNDGESLGSPPTTQPVNLGRAKGWQLKSRGMAGTLELLNVETAFTSKLSDQVDDGTILLVAPLSTSAKAEDIYSRFVRSLAIGQ